MKKFEIIVKTDEAALRLELPDDVVTRIKDFSSFNDDDFEELDNEAIMKIIIKSLDKILYGFSHSSSHSMTERKSELGQVRTEKKKNETKK